MSKRAPRHKRGSDDDLEAQIEAAVRIVAHSAGGSAKFTLPDGRKIKVTSEGKLHDRLLSALKSAEGLALLGGVLSVVGGALSVEAAAAQDQTSQTARTYVAGPLAVEVPAWAEVVPRTPELTSLLATWVEAPASSRWMSTAGNVILGVSGSDEPSGLLRQGVALSRAADQSEHAAARDCFERAIASEDNALVKWRAELSLAELIVDEQWQRDYGEALELIDRVRADPNFSGADGRDRWRHSVAAARLHARGGNAAEARRNAQEALRIAREFQSSVAFGGAAVMRSDGTLEPIELSGPADLFGPDHGTIVEMEALAK